ncbi:MAG: hypothetical protein ACFBSE_10865 [Prochloraceae cyanobacterium]
MKHFALARASYRKYLKTIILTANAIEQLDSKGMPITVKSVSTFANIPASSLYSNPMAKELINLFKSTNQVK